MTEERVVYLNGEIIPESEAGISIHDMGFVMGDAVYDTTRTFGGKIFKLSEHLDRFERSLKYMRIDPGLSKEEWTDLTEQVLAANLHLLGENDDFWVTQRVTRGVAISDRPGPPVYRPTVLIQCQPLPFAARARYYRDGLPVIIPSVRRVPPECTSPRAKVHNYVNLVQGRLEAQAQNPDAWAILLDVNGNVAEGSGSNFFVVKDGVVTTPREQYVLPGVSRETVLELSAELGIETREADIDLYDTYTADEAFVTSTSFCICPVCSVNGITMGGGEIPAAVTGRLLKAYSDLVGVDIAQQYLSFL